MLLGFLLLFPNLPPKGFKNPFLENYLKFSGLLVVLNAYSKASQGLLP